MELFSDTTIYDSTKCLPFVFCWELNTNFERLSSLKLLSSCKNGLTQNQNELLNNVLWAKC